MERLAFSDEAGLEKHLGAPEALAADRNDMPSGSSYFVFLSELSVVSLLSVPTSQAMSHRLSSTSRTISRSQPEVWNVADNCRTTDVCLINPTWVCDGMVVRNLRRSPVQIQHAGDNKAVVPRAILSSTARLKVRVHSPISSTKLATRWRPPTSLSQGVAMMLLSASFQPSATKVG
jgi:hypothetical protein